MAAGLVVYGNKATRTGNSFLKFDFLKRGVRIVVYQGCNTYLVVVVVVSLCLQLSRSSPRWVKSC